jgi:hypothetical protein
MRAAQIVDADFAYPWFHQAIKRTLKVIGAPQWIFVNADAPYDEVVEN